jgi:hypothetical protein
MSAQSRLSGVPGQNVHPGADDKGHEPAGDHRSRRAPTPLIAPSTHAARGALYRLEILTGGARTVCVVWFWLPNEVLSRRVLGGGVAPKRRELRHQKSGMPSRFRPGWLDERRHVTTTGMIGIDPHKGSHAAAAIDATEAGLGQVRMPAEAEQLERPLGRAFGSRPGQSRTLVDSAICWPSS